MKSGEPAPHGGVRGRSLDPAPGQPGRRGMAQLGSASALGAEGPRFESGYPDPHRPSMRLVIGGTAGRLLRPYGLRWLTACRCAPSHAHAPSCIPEPTPQESTAVKSAVETLNPTRVKLTVEVPFEELKPSLDAAYKKISQQVTVPGFRKGKVPPRIIDQRFGRGAVLEEAVNEALPQLLRAGGRGERASARSASPTVDITEVPDPAKGGELKFTAEVDVRPELELPDYSRASRSRSTTSRSRDDDVDERLDALRERFGTLVGVERAAADGRLRRRST